MSAFEARDRAVQQGRGPGDHPQRAGSRRRQAAAQLGGSVQRARHQVRASHSVFDDRPACVISGNDKIEQLAFPTAEDFNLYSHQVQRVNLKICYCSSLGDCWQYDDAIANPGEQHPSGRSLPRAQRRRFPRQRRCRTGAAGTRTGQVKMSEPVQIIPEAQEIRRAVRRRGGQHRAVHGRPHRQRSALSRLRHPRFRDDQRVRGNRVPARARQIADARGTRRRTRRS